MVVFQIDLDEGLPVVVALVQLDPVERVAAEVEVGPRPQASQVGRHVAAAAVAVLLEEQAVPLFQRVIVQVEAGVLREVRGADQFASGARVGGCIGPAVQRTDDVAARARVEFSAALQDQRLPVPADVGDQLDALGRVHQRAAVVLLWQRVEVAHFGHGQAVADIARPVGEKRLQLAGVEGLVEVRGNRELALGLLQLKT